MANRVGSILAADFGSVSTRVVLVDVVDGAYRVIAREKGVTTLGYPADDVSIGLHQLIDRISYITGRKFYKGDQIITPEAADRNGVDYFITTASAGRPLRAVIVGLIPDISLISALRAISGAYIRPVEEIHLRDGRSEEDRLNAIILSRPDLIFISGGIEGGAAAALRSIMDTVELALRITDESLRPMVMYAGNTSLFEEVKTRFEPLTKLYLARNVRPEMDEETFESALHTLGEIYDDHRETSGDSFRTVSQMSGTGVLPTAQSYSLVAEYFGKTRKQNVIAIDIGSTSSVLAATFKEVTSTRISTETGIGHSAVLLLEKVGEYAVERWLPFYPEQGELLNYAYNKTVRPASIPMNQRELYIEHAFLRAGARDMLTKARNTWPEVPTRGDLPPIGLVVAGGAGLTETGHPAYNMMLIADAVQPIGVTEIKADTNGLIPALGALARLNPEATVQLLEGSSLEHVGTLISFDGAVSRDRKIARLTITTNDGEKVNYELNGGNVLSLSLPENFSLDIRIVCSRGHSVGGKKRLHLKLSGGSAGIMFDARGRHNMLPEDVAVRAKWMPQWISQVTDDPVQAIPTEWLVESKFVNTTDITKPPKRSEEESVAALLALSGIESERSAPKADDDIFGFNDDDDDDDFSSLFDDDNDDSDIGSLRDLL